MNKPQGPKIIGNLKSKTNISNKKILLICTIKQVKIGPDLKKKFKVRKPFNGTAPDWASRFYNEIYHLMFSTLLLYSCKHFLQGKALGTSIHNLRDNWMRKLYPSHF